MVAILDRLEHRGADAPRAILDLGPIGKAAGGRKFVAAQPRDDLAFATHGAEPFGYGLKHAVARGVTKSVIHVLEAIKIDGEHRQQRPILFRRADLLVQPGVEAGAVGKARQRIVERHELDPRLGAALLGDVGAGRHPAAAGQRAVSERDDAAMAQLHRNRANGVAAQRLRKDLPEVLHTARRVVRPVGVHEASDHQRAQRGARLRPRLIQVPDLPEAAIAQKQPLVRVEQAQPLVHVLQRRIKPA